MRWVRTAWWASLLNQEDYPLIERNPGARGVSLTFSSGDGGVVDGDPNPATQECFTNDGRNKTEFIPLFPPSCPL